MSGGLRVLSAHIGHDCEGNDVYESGGTHAGTVSTSSSTMTNTTNEFIFFRNRLCIDYCSSCDPQVKQLPRPGYQLRWCYDTYVLRTLYVGGKFICYFLKAVNRGGLQ